MTSTHTPLVAAVVVVDTIGVTFCIFIRYIYGLSYWAHVVGEPTWAT